MNRPMYETKEDLANERRIQATIEKRYGCLLRKMPIKLQLDFMAWKDGKAVGFVEARQRKTPMMKYPTYMISLHKVLMAQQLTATTNLPCYLAVQFSDKLAMCKLPPDDPNNYVDFGGSDRRDDPQDYEPMLYFDMSNFKEVTHDNAGS